MPKKQETPTPAWVQDAVPSGYIVKSYQPIAGRHSLSFVDACIPFEKSPPDYGHSHPYEKLVMKTRTSGADKHWPHAGVNGNSYTDAMHHFMRDQALYVKAFDRLSDSLHEGSLTLGLDLPFAGQTFETIADYTTRIASGLNHLRRGRFTLAANAIGHGKRFANLLERESRRKVPRRGVRPLLREMGSQYLVYTYACEPLYNTIVEARKNMDGIATVSSPIKGSAKQLHLDERTSQSSRSGYTDHRTYWALDRVKIGVTVVVDNPNLYLLNRLGLLNVPLAIENMIPFSFVLDWWLGHEAWLASLDMWAGLKILDQYVTTSREGRYNEYLWVQDKYGEPYYRLANEFYAFRMKRSVDKIKTPGIGDRVKLFPFQSWRRSLNGAVLATKTLKLL